MATSATTKKSTKPVLDVKVDPVHAIIELKYNSKLIFPYDVGLEFMLILKHAEVFDGYSLTESSARITDFGDSAPTLTLLPHQLYTEVKMRELLTANS